MKILFDYAGSAGRSAIAPRSWPPDSPIARDLTRPTLVMLAHPRCPCTRASIGELAILMSRASGLVRAHVMFVRPEGADAAFEATDLWNSAARIPGVTVHSDVRGQEASRLGAKTSGQVVLYGTDNRLLFQGGITAARGHMGDNAGVDRIVSLLTRGTAERATSSVYGCSLFEETRQ